jgi:hypothetical protein
MSNIENKGGRPTKMTEATLGKLRQAFLLGASDKEACLLADIHPDTLYAYQKKNPEYSEQKKVLKLNPVLKARQTIFKSLSSPRIAMWYLERRARAEFGNELEDQNDQPPVALVEFVGGDRPKGRHHVR